MTIKYTVTFAWRDDSKNDLYGYGTADIETDEVVETDEQLKEVARTIGMKNNFTQVVVTALEEAQPETEETSAFSL